MTYRQEFEADVADRFDLNGTFHAKTRSFPARAAGSMTSSADDLARFALAVLGDELGSLRRAYMHLRSEHQFALKAKEGEGRDGDC